MDCLSLIQHAQEAGFQLRIDAGNLVIRGPKRYADLAKQLIEHKSEVLLVLQPAADVDADYDAGGERQAIQDEAREAEARIALADDAAVDDRFADWQASLDEAGMTVLTPPNYAADFDLIDAADLSACLKCGSLELWQSEVGTWRCSKCDPPARADGLRKLADKIRRKHPRVKTTTADKIDAPGCPRIDAEA